NTRVYSVLDNVVASAPGYATRFATAIYVLGRYLVLLLYPAHLSMDYSFRQIELVGLSHPFVIVSLVVYGAMLAIALRTMKEPGPAGFGFGFYLITISLVSNLVIVIGTVMAERLVYTPSLGICLASAALLGRVLPAVGAPQPWSLGNVLRTHQRLALVTL